MAPPVPQDETVLSLPPAPPESAEAPPSFTPSEAITGPPERIRDGKIRARKWWKEIRQPEIKRKAMLIVAMRIQGWSDRAIAKELGIMYTSVRQYVYLAGKNKWLDMPTAEDATKYNLLPKALKKVFDAIDSKTKLASGMSEGNHVALEIAKGTAFKQFEKGATAAPSTVVAVRIEMPGGPQQEMREDTFGGTPAVFRDGEIEDDPDT